MALLESALLGIIFGGVYALSATGIVLTYTATGVFNIAHFAVALLAGYLAWQLNAVVGLPLLATVPIVLLLCGPLLGLTLERLVYRPLQARGAGSAEKLVASLGVTVLLLAAVNVVWGPGVQGGTEDPVPRVFPVEPFAFGSLRFDTEQVGVVLTILAVAAGLYLLLRRTFLGTSIRAVVDRRELAELAAIDANRVSQVAWALGCTLGALTGLLIAPPVLEPNRIIILGIETFSVAVVARLTSIPVALGFGFFVMGMGRGILDGFAPFGSGDGNLPALYDQLILNLSSVVLFAALVLFRRLDEVGSGSSSGLTGGAVAERTSGVVRRVQGAIALGIALLVPLALTGADLRMAHRFLALVVIFASITAITGFSGHVTLGQASIAGLGAFATARLTAEFDLPVLLATIPGVGIAVVAGLAAGYPALKRKGLFLGLTTLGLALVIYQFVFNAQIPVIAGGAGMLQVRRPTLFGLDLGSDTAFWYYELAVVVAVLALVHNVRRGPLGRVLAAMRDSEPATSSVGIDLRASKLFVFGVSSGVAGLGGVLLTQAEQNFDATAFYPIFGLFWFTAVVVCGAASLRGAIIAAAFYVAVPHLTGQDVQSAVGVFGIGALLLGRLPGGLVPQLRRLPGAATRVLARAWREAEAPPPREVAPFEPSALARKLLAARGTR